MPWPNSHLPKYRKHRASGQAIVTLGGRDFYLGPHRTAASRREYDRLISEWLANGRRVPGRDDTPLSVAEVMASYWRHVKTYYQRDGKLNREGETIRSTLRFINALYRDLPATDFGPLALKAVRSRMVERGLARTSVNQNIGRIKRMFRWAAAEQMIPVEIVTALGTVDGLRRGRTEARETAPVLPVGDDAIQATLNHLPAVVADMVRLQRLTAMRPGEVCLLRPSDLDRGGDVWVFRPERHKTEHHGRERTVLIGKQGQALLGPYLDRDPEAYCFRPRDSEARRRAEAYARRQTPIAHGNRPGTNRSASPKRRPGERYTVDSYRRAIHRACDKAGVPRWSPNRLRHTAATEIRAKFGLEAAQVILGHSAADVTQVYAERDLAKGVEVVREIG